ncbi:hypothetical protein NKG94_16505 [Micromonospora sp. M12]
MAGQTRLLSVNLDTGKIAAPITVATELTSAVPVPGGIVAAAKEQLVRVDAAGKASGLTRTAGVAYGLVPDAAGRVVYLEHAGDQARVRVADAARRRAASTLAQGGRTGLGWRRGRPGLHHRRERHRAGRAAGRDHSGVRTVGRDRVQPRRAGADPGGVRR